MRDNYWKKCLNISTNWWNGKIYKKITRKMVLILAIMLILTAALGALAGVTAPPWVAIIIIVVMLSLSFLFTVNNGLILDIFTNAIKYLFTAKTKTIKNIDVHNGIIKLNNRKLIFFEIECSPLTGTEQQIYDKIEDFCDEISSFVNWSIINTFLPYSGLNDNNLAVDKKIESYLKNHKNDKDLENDPIFQNLLVNKILLKQYTEGKIQKNTYLLAFELKNDVSAESLINNIKQMNLRLKQGGFKIVPIDDEVFEFVKNELFFHNKKIHISHDHIKCNDNLYSFLKVNDLPNYLRPCFLDFLNDLGRNQNVDVNFVINTYNLKNLKKEDRVWDKAIKMVEAELEQASKRKEVVQAEANYIAVNELTENLIQQRQISQKYEIIICIKSNNKKQLVEARKYLKRHLLRKELFTYEDVHFRQYEFLNSFTRNIYLSNYRPKNIKVLPNNLIAWSYPFRLGNNYLDSGFYLGELFNGNPVFLSLNLGHKINNSSLIIGKTGSGKSTFMNYVLKNNMSEQNVTTIVLDPKGEYADSSTIQKMKPTIIGLSSDSDLVLNPFDLTKDDKDDEKHEFILKFLTIWFGDISQDILLDIQNKLSEAIMLSIKKNKYNIEFIYEQLVKIANKDKNDKNNKIMLDTLRQILPNGVYNYFTKPTKVNINDKNKLVIFNLDVILQNFDKVNQIKVWLLFKFLKSRIFNTQNKDENNKNKIQLLVDEFPLFLNSNAPFVAKELIRLVRVVRSYDASIFLAMQDVATLFSNIRNNTSEIGDLSSLANNAAHIFIMQLTQEQLNLVQTIWGDSVELTSDENIQITSKFGTGDILYMEKNNRYYFNSTDPLSKFSSNHKIMEQEVKDLMKQYIKSNKKEDSDNV